MTEYLVTKIEFTNHMFTGTKHLFTAVLKISGCV